MERPSRNPENPFIRRNESLEGYGLRISKLSVAEFLKYQKYWLAFLDNLTDEDRDIVFYELLPGSSGSDKK